MNLLVVGAGEMGRWFASTLAAEDVAVAFADADPATAEDAAAAVGGRAVPTDTDERFDLVCVAVPIPAATEAIAAFADRAERAMVDVTGVMTDPVSAMAEHGPELERASFHPLFAPANAPGSVPAVVAAGGPITDRVVEALTAAGNDVFETTSAEHDRTMETVQAQVHSAVLAFGLAAEEVPEEYQTPVSAGLFDLLAEVTGNDPGVYADIQAAFDGSEDVARAARRLADADSDTFADLYREATPDGTGGSSEESGHAQSADDAPGEDER